MKRWSIIGVGTTIVVVIGVVLSRPSRKLQSTDKNADTAAIESTAPTPEKPVPQKLAPPSAPYHRAQTKQTYAKLSEPERLSLKPPEALGPIKLFKGLYQDESHDPTYESLERLIRAQFDPKIFPIERLHTISCRKSICKISVFWSFQQQMVLAGVLMNVSPVLSTYYAFEPVTEPDEKGDVLFEMYVLRKGFKPEDFR